MGKLARVILLLVGLPMEHPPMLLLDSGLATNLPTGEQESLRMLRHGLGQKLVRGRFVGTLLLGEKGRDVVGWQRFYWGCFGRPCKHRDYGGWRLFVP